jgi:hypothetical protein
VVARLEAAAAHGAVPGQSDIKHMTGKIAE